MENNKCVYCGAIRPQINTALGRPIYANCTCEQATKQLKITLTHIEEERQVETNKILQALEDIKNQCITIPTKYKNANFDNFTIDDTNRACYNELYDFSDGNVLILGGTGKTHLSCALINKLKINKSTMFVRDLTNTHIDIDLLIIDDLGSKILNEDQVQLLYNTIVTRDEEGKSTIINTSLTLAELQNRLSRDLVISNKIIDKLENNYKILEITRKNKFLRR